MMTIDLMNNDIFMFLSAGVASFAVLKLLTKQNTLKLEKVDDKIEKVNDKVDKGFEKVINIIDNLSNNFSTQFTSVQVQLAKHETKLEANCGVTDQILHDMRGVRSGYKILSEISRGGENETRDLLNRIENLERKKHL